MSDSRGAAPEALSVLAGAEDTIAAVATAPGRSALAIVRMSGSRAGEIAGRVLRPWPIPERHATLCTVRDPRSDEVVDRCLVTVFGTGRSFTGELIVELATHGGSLVPALVLRTLLAAGARQARPGEFTARAVAHGRLDLLQAEAIGDLIDATSTAAHRSALHQLDGRLSTRIAALREALIEIEALIAYDLDFPEEDEGPIPRARVSSACERALGSLDALLRTAHLGELIRDGALVVLAGAPNVGKSSLFNALLGQSRAIVTDVPGTTRDALEALVDLHQVAIRLVDTAGLRTTVDVVERLGVEVSERYLGAADLVLACGDTPGSLGSTVERIRTLSTAPVLGVATKADLVSTGYESRLTGGAGQALELVASCTLSGEAARDSSSNGWSAAGVPVVSASARTGEGLTALTEAITTMIAQAGGIDAGDEPVLTRERHRVAVERARQELTEFRACWEGGEVPAVIAAIHLRSAITILDELIGRVDLEDVLDRLFSTFCIGK